MAKPENTKRKYKRERRYTAGTVTVSITAEMRRDLDRLADADNAGLAVTLRRCLAAGIPRVKEAARKRRMRAGTSTRQ